jgi:hypothetical protein
MTKMVSIFKRRLSVFESACDFNLANANYGFHTRLFTILVFKVVSSASGAGGDNLSLENGSTLARGSNVNGSINNGNLQINPSIGSNNIGSGIQKNKYARP